MDSWIRQICALSILCGAALAMAPEGFGKRMLSFACTVALLFSALSACREIRFEDYALEAARYRERSHMFLEQAEERQIELDRRVVERELERYLLDTAEGMGLTVSEIHVALRWNLDGLWVPESVRICGDPDAPGSAGFSARIESELGIPREKQEWNW